MTPKKSLGQHFLQCGWVVTELIKAAELKSTDLVLEIGPGTGVLTKALARGVKKIIAVEKDERLAEELEQTLKKEGIDNVEIIKGDILNMFDSILGLALDISKAKPRIKNYKIVANIPYFLTSRLLRIIFEQKIKPKLVVLTIQKEVAQRIVAPPPDMNLIALSVQIFGRPRLIKIVPAGCFWPKPKVNSAIIKIDKISDKFFQKRKMLVNSLSKIAPKERVIRALEKAKINSKARPEELTQEQWAKIVVNMR